MGRLSFRKQNTVAHNAPIVMLQQMINDSFSGAERMRASAT
jgi:hypothetical protein